MLSYKEYLEENVDKQTLKDMEYFGLYKSDIDENGHVTLYHGGINLPKKLIKGEIFFMTPFIDEAKDYARMRKGKVFTLKVDPTTVNWNQGSREVEFENGGVIIDGTIIPNPKKTKTKRNVKRFNINDDWVGKENSRSIKSYNGLSVGDVTPKTKWKILDIVQHKNGGIQFQFPSGWYSGEQVINYEFS